MKKKILYLHEFISYLRKKISYEKDPLIVVYQIHKSELFYTKFLFLYKVSTNNFLTEDAIKSKM